MKPQYPTSRHFDGYDPLFIGSVGPIDVYIHRPSTHHPKGFIGFQEFSKAWWVWNSRSDGKWNMDLPHDGCPRFDPDHIKEARNLGMTALNLLS